MREEFPDPKGTEPDGTKTVGILLANALRSHNTHTSSMYKSTTGGHKKITFTNTVCSLIRPAQATCWPRAPAT